MARKPQHLQAAAAYLAEHGETRMTALAEGIGVSVGTLYSALATALVRGEITKRNEGRSVFYRLPEQGTVERIYVPPAVVDEAAKEFNAAAWADGDVDLYGLIELEDGGYRMTPGMVGRLRVLLAGAA